MFISGRILDVGKIDDKEGPAIAGRNIKHNGCVDHRLDKIHLTISKHPHLQSLFSKLRSISSHIHKSSQSLDHAVACAKVVGVEFTTIKSIVETRWWSLYTHVDSIYANKKTLIWQRDSPKNSLVPPAVYDLSDHDWIDLEWIREITKAIKIVQEELEGEKYITGSRVIPLLEGVRARLDSTQTHFENTESPSGKFVDLMLFM